MKNERIRGWQKPFYGLYWVPFCVLENFYALHFLDNCTFFVFCNAKYLDSVIFYKIKELTIEEHEYELMHFALHYKSKELILGFTKTNVLLYVFFFNGVDYRGVLLIVNWERYFGGLIILTLENWLLMTYVSGCLEKKHNI